MVLLCTLPLNSNCRFIHFPLLIPSNHEKRKRERWWWASAVSDLVILSLWCIYAMIVLGPNYRLPVLPALQYIACDWQISMYELLWDRIRCFQSPHICTYSHIHNNAPLTAHTYIHRTHQHTHTCKHHTHIPCSDWHFNDAQYAREIDAWRSLADAYIIEVSDIIYISTTSQYMKKTKKKKRRGQDGPIL